MTDAAADRAADADEHRGEVIGLPPLVRLDPAVAVEVLADGEWWPRVRLHLPRSAGQRQLAKGPGMQHITWEPADHVRRT